jgi:hypothetical protein
MPRATHLTVTNGTLLGIAFHQDIETLSVIDRALEITAARSALAA